MLVQFPQYVDSELFAIDLDIFLPNTLKTILKIFDLVLKTLVQISSVLFF